MMVVASGVVVRWMPSGYSVVGWHRHDHLVSNGEEDTVYSDLTTGEMLQVIENYVLSYTPGLECEQCTGQQQIQLWADARRSDRS